MLSLVFWQWGGSRPLVLSSAFALVVFGLSTGLPLAVSRATAAAAGAPRVDVVQCANCPFFFYDAMTVFPSVINSAIWLVGVALLLRKKLRPSGSLLVRAFLIAASVFSNFIPGGVHALVSSGGTRCGSGHCGCADA